MEEPEANGSTRPVHRRSRRGCRTCRIRRKKCPETYDEAGVCGRCAAAGLHCDRSSAPASRLPPSRDNSANSTTSTTSSATSASTSTSPPPAPGLNTTGPWPSYSSTDSMTTPTSTSFLDGHFVFVPRVGDPSQPASTLAAPFCNSPPRMESPPLPEPSYAAPLPPVYRPYPPITSTAPLPLPVALPAPSSAPSTNGSAAAPPARRPPPRRTTTIGKELSCSLWEWRMLEMAGGRNFANGGGGKVDVASSSDELYDLGAAKSLCEEVDDGLIISMPEHVRRRLRVKLVQVMFGNNCTTFAALAMATSMRAKISPVEGTADGLALRAQSYYQRAMEGLQAQPDLPMEVRLVALLDVAIFSMEQHGAAAGYPAYSLVDLLLGNVMGPLPIPYTALYSEHCNLLLRYFALVDILRAIGSDRRTFFSYPDPTPYSLPSVLVEGELVDGEGEFMRGAPVFLLLTMAATCNLAQDEPLMDPTHFLEQAKTIERAIEGWRWTGGSVFGNDEKDGFLEATREMWRHAALINLRTIVFHLGPLHTSIRNSVKQIISLGSGGPGVVGLPAGGVRERACPWFLASTVALEFADREVCRSALSLGLPMRLARDRLEAAERLWALVDGCGFPIDWRKALAAEGRYIAWM
ncbi:hypothetical protein BCR35DRAFT_304188 [Leucosporidium creatinivorum]|uniref:Zn(2)-C6 fungal-type domain-containing protein n=1 Tax=Leucosporidium creatinivorum TaxID=106004 RepID=A0A1Y2F9R9_9BASI|nr:hypothetical protein BCR35DRAFT_304188 [Leucosporidium creatinivorum]